MKKVFVCSPYRGDIEKNTKMAKRIARLLCKCGYLPILPHLYFPQFLREKDQPERILGIELGVELMKECDLIWLIGPVITNGMEYELLAAKELGIPVEIYDGEINQIKAKTLSLDDRVNEKFCDFVKGLNLV